MSDNEPVCECGHDFTAHYERSTVCHYCECTQFTDARLAALRAENDELKRVANMGGWYFAYMEEAVPKILRLENTISTLEAEVARLTPRMVRELPTKEAKFWYRRDGEHKIYPVAVYVGGGRTHLMAFAEGWRESVPLTEVCAGWWSAEPITMPEIEKEGE